MAIGPLIQSITNGDPVTADKVYGNDVALRDFVSSLPNENLEKPTSIAVVPGSITKVFNASSNNTVYFGYSELPASVQEAVRATGVSIYFEIDKSAATLLGDVVDLTVTAQYWDGASWNNTIAAVSIPPANWAGVEEDTGSASTYGYLEQENAAVSIPAGSRIRFKLDLDMTSHASTMGVVGSGQVYIKPRHQTS